MKQIYLDNAATTKISDEVAKAMQPFFTDAYANPSSKHFAGIEVRKAVEQARKIIADKIGAKSSEIIFTSGGTESNNFALKGLFFTNFPVKNHIITTKIEHDSVLNVCKWLEKQGAKVTYLNVNKEGFVDIKDIEKAITKKTFIVSIIHGNNEIGTIQNIEAIGEVCRRKGIIFHTDACQSFTKTPINVNKQKLDMVTLNAHKIHGPKGIGVLYIKDGIKITPLLQGGGQERGLRSGTENVPGIVGFAKAVELTQQKDRDNMKKLKDILIKNLLKISGIKLNGSVNNRLCNNVNISFENIDGETILSYLENAGIYASVGSACISNFSEKSHVLKAIGLDGKTIESSLRISLSKYNTEKEIIFFLEKLRKIVKGLKNTKL